MRFFFRLIILIVFTGSAFAGDEGFYFTASPSWNADYTSGFSKLPGIPNCCPEFTDGSGYTTAFGLSYEMPLNDFYKPAAGISLAPGLYYHHGSGPEFLSTEKTFVIYNGATTPGEFEHHMKLSLGYFSVAIPLRARQGFFGLKIPALEGFSVSAGPYMSFIANSKYSQFETISQPKGAGTFIGENGEDTGSRIRNDTSGTIPGARFFFWGLNISLDYEMPLNKEKSIFLAFGAGFSNSLSSLHEEFEWGSSAYRATLSLKWNPFAEKKLSVPELMPPFGDSTYLAYLRPQFADSLLALPDLLEHYETAPFEPDEKKELVFEYDTLERVSSEIIETETTRLDTIFVKSGGPVKLWARGIGGGKDIKLARAVKYTALPVTNAILLNIQAEKNGSPFLAEDYYQILFREISERMKSMPGASLLLSGKISPPRLVEIKKYISQKYGLPQEALIIDTSSENIPGGLGKNQAILLKANPGELLNPIIKTADILVFESDSIEFTPEFGRRLKPNYLKLNITDGPRLLIQFEYSGKLPKKIIWESAKEVFDLNNFSGAASYEMEIRDKNGSRYILSGELARWPDGENTNGNGIACIEFLYKGLKYASPDILSKVMIAPDSIKALIEGNIRVLNPLPEGAAKSGGKKNDPLRHSGQIED